MQALFSIAMCLHLLLAAGANAVAAESVQPSKEMPRTSSQCTVSVPVVDVIGPATVDLLERVSNYAVQQQCESILLVINTPGGSLESTRIIVEKILNSPLPYLCLVSPSGGHAGSAGAIILQACHVNGGVHGTNLGAATPVMMGGEMPKDIRHKIINDTRSWLESLTRLRGRNDKFGQDIIENAKAVTTEDALKLKAIDFVGHSEAEFLKFAHGRKVKLAGNQETAVQTGEAKLFELDLRYKVTSLLTDPELAYMMLLGSLGLLYFEFTHPGSFVAGTVGAVGLIVALIALNKLEVEWAGLMLIFLGIGLIIAEMFLPTFGALGIGGLVSFVLGSIFLFDPVKTMGYRLPLQLILPVGVLMATVFFTLSWLMWRTRAVKKRGGYDDLIGLIARVARVDNANGGMLEVQGETWSFISAEPLRVNDRVMITGHQGLVLKVRIQNPTTIPDSVQS